MSAVSINTATAILSQLATENRRVVSDWRALILLRRATLQIAPARRRWTALPDQVTQMHPLLKQMQRRGELAPIAHTRYLYAVTVPYAQTHTLTMDEHEILMELNPYAALCVLSALAFHNLTTDLPKVLHALVPARGTAGMLPPDTYPDDWEGIASVRGQRPDTIQRHPVQWITASPGRYFGVAEYRPSGYPVRVTTPERTLLDGLLSPEALGGLDTVLRAWRFARDTMNIETLVEYVAQFAVAVLRQRVGFVLEALGMRHPVLDQWQTAVQRGGNSKLLASAPYAPIYSERWALSLNAPLGALYGDGE